MATLVLPEYTTEVQNAEWGSRFQGELPTDEGVLIDVFTNDHFPGFPNVLGVHLYRLDRSTFGVGASFNADVHALVSYSNGGVSNSFSCDWRGQFPLVASSLRITAKTYAPSGIDGYNAPAGRQVIYGAMVSIGNCNGATPLTYSLSTESVADTQSAAVPVADFARRYVPMIVDENDEPLTPVQLPSVQLRFFNKGIQCIGGQNCNADILRDGVPIPGGCEFITVGNNTGLTLKLGHQFLLGL